MQQCLIAVPRDLCQNRWECPHATLTGTHWGFSNSLTSERMSEQGNNQSQMFQTKTTALEQKLSLTKAGVTGEPRAAPCREGAASHGSSTKERLFSLTSALRENSLEIIPDTPKREFSEPGKPETMLCNSSSLQCSATALHRGDCWSAAGICDSSPGRGTGNWGWIGWLRMDWVRIVRPRFTVKLPPFIKMLPGSQPALQKHKVVMATQQTTNELLRGEQSWGEGRRKQAGQVLQ